MRELIDTLPPVHIRPCRRSDLVGLEWFEQFRDHREIIARTFEGVARGEQVMLVADLLGFPAGQIWIELSRARLWAARVYPTLRGRGIGTLLVAAAEEELARRGAPRAAVGVERSNRPALAFWLRCGYQPCGHEIAPYSYLTPDGVRVDALADLLLLDKDLRRTEHARHPVDDR